MPLPMMFYLPGMVRARRISDGQGKAELVMLPMEMYLEFIYLPGRVSLARAQGERAMIGMKKADMIGSKAS